MQEENGNNDELVPFFLNPLFSVKFLVGPSIVPGLDKNKYLPSLLQISFLPIFPPKTGKFLNYFVANTEFKIMRDIC